MERRRQLSCIKGEAADLLQHPHVKLAAYDSGNGEHSAGVPR